MVDYDVWDNIIMTNWVEHCMETDIYRSKTWWNAVKVNKVKECTNEEGKPMGQ